MAHVKDRGVASASIRCLAIAGECLVDRREQEEVLDMFRRIKQEAGWRVDFLIDELKARWGWNVNKSPLQQFPPDQQAPQHSHHTSLNGGSINGMSSNVSSPTGQNHGNTNNNSNNNNNVGTAFFTPQGVPTMPPVPAQPPQRPKFPSGIVNPMYATADFSKPQHPYQTHYVPPLANSLHDTSMFHFG